MSATTDVDTNSPPASNASAIATRFTLPPVYVPTIMAVALLSSGIKFFNAKNARNPPATVPIPLIRYIMIRRPESFEIFLTLACKSSIGIASGTT